MADYTVRRVGEMSAAFGGGLRRARAELGVGSFGLAVLELPPGSERYPEHDHRGDGQEEVYVVLRGVAEMELDDERVALDSETMIRVGPLQRRRLRAGPDGARLLVVGATPGAVYDPPDFSRLDNLPLVGG